MSSIIAQSSQGDLFGGSADGPPEGFWYQAELLSPDEERALLHEIQAIPLQETPYGQYLARRRTMSYGAEYEGTTRAFAPRIPAFLVPVRAKIAQWAGLVAEDFVQGLVSEYRPGTPLGWHRDAPQFETVIGVSLGGSCRMRLRPYRAGERRRRADVIVVDLQPRSAYRLQGVARSQWQHSIAPTQMLRYSVTFRSRGV